MDRPDFLTTEKRRHINALAISFPITGNQEIRLFQLADKDRARGEAALIGAEVPRENVYAGALHRLVEIE